MTDAMSEPSAFPVGTSAAHTVQISAELVDRFAALSGDDNPLHMRDDFARTAGFSRRVAHGALAVAFLSTLIGKQMPGTGALWRAVRVDWVRPVYVDDVLTLTATVVRRSSNGDSLKLEVTGTNQLGTVVLRGDADVGLTEQSFFAPRATDAAAPTSSSAHASAVTDASRRVVLVTGASRGIGRAIALGLGKQGYAVGVGFNAGSTDADQVVHEIVSTGGAAVPVRIDVRERSGFHDPLAALASTLGRCTGFVHAATPPLLHQTFEESDDDAFDLYYNAYVRASASIVRTMIPAMREAKWGRVALLATTAVVGVPPAKMSAYVTAKSALLGLSRALAVELGPLGTTVNVVSPGLVATDLTRDYSPRTRLAEAQRAPMRRLAVPEDVSALINYLFSEQGSFITGAHLPVNGGIGMIG